MTILCTPVLNMPPTAAGHIVYVCEGELSCHEFTTVAELVASPHGIPAAEYNKDPVLTHIVADWYNAAPIKGVLLLRIPVKDDKIDVCDDAIFQTLRKTIGIGVYSYGFIRCSAKTIELFARRWIGVGRTACLGDLFFNAGLSFRLDCYNHPEL